MKTSLISLRLLLCCALLLLGNGLSAQFNPVAYWDFEQTNPGADASGNNVTLIGFGPSSPLPTLQASGGARGKYALLSTPGNSLYFSAAGYTQLQSLNLDTAAFTIEFWAKMTSINQFNRPLWWQNKTWMEISENRMEVRVQPGNNFPERIFVIPFDGYGRKSAAYHFDGDWHHYAISYHAQAGDLKVYIDGISPAEFRTHFGSSSGVLWPNSLELGSDAAYGYHYGGLDEVAVYDTVLPEALIYQHYTEIRGNNAYTFTPTLSAPLPYPTGYLQINPQEYAPGYPQVAELPRELLQSYPDPRYDAHHGMPALLPFTPQPSRFGSDTGSIAFKLGEAAGMMKELIRTYRYAHLLGVTNWANITIDSTFTWASSVNKLPFFANIANDPEFQNVERAIITQWPSSWPSFIGNTTYAYPYINYNGIPDSTVYLFDASTQQYDRNKWSPLSSLDSTKWKWIRDQEGATQKAYLDSIFANIDSASRFVDYIMENDEIYFPLPSSDATRDPQVVADWNSSGAGSWLEYQSMRSDTIRRAYMGPLLDLIGQHNAQRGRPQPTVNWYNMSESRFWPWEYQHSSPILQSRDSLRRPSPYYYPNATGRWRYGASAFSGLNDIVSGRSIEIDSRGHRFFSPYVSPGFSDQNWTSDDRKMLRPGNYLGVLKQLSIMGADQFVTFYYNTRDSLPYGYPASWRPWKLVMPSYAQATFSRQDSLLYDSELLEGDGRYMVGFNSFANAKYTYRGSQPLHLIGVRKHRADSTRYLISASIQRNSNMAGQGPKQSVTSIYLADAGDSLRFRIREQGNTYVYDKSDPQNVLWYQLDTWHEWREPMWWCRDFFFEAEVADSMGGDWLRKTEVPLTASAGDYRDFTSYSRPIQAGPWTVGNGPFMDFYFNRRSTDQDSLYLWARMRSRDGSAVSVTAFLNGGSPQNTSSISDTHWVWVPVGSLPLVSVLGRDSLRLYPNQGAFELDRILLRRDSGNVNTASLSAAFSHSAPTCVNDTAWFTNQSQTSGSCVEFHWTFGDGKDSWGPGPVVNVYRQPGSYPVTLEVHDPLLDSTAVFMDTVNILGPALVEAGQDTFVCPAQTGDSLILQGQSSVSSHWWYVISDVGDTLKVDSLNLNPVIVVDSNEYYHLEATETFVIQGFTYTCSRTDSVHVTVPSIDLIAPDSAFTCGTPTALLEARGAFHYQWSPFDLFGDSSLANQTIPYPGNDTLLQIVGFDQGFCVSDTEEVYLRATPLREADPDTILGYCYGDIVTVNADPAVSYLWLPNGVYVDSTLQQTQASFSIGQIPRVIIRDFRGCVFYDTLTLVKPLPRCTPPGLDVQFTCKVNASDTLPQLGSPIQGKKLFFSDSLLIDTTLTFISCTFYLDSTAVIYVQPGKTFTTQNCLFQSACGESMWQGIVLDDSSSAWISEEDTVIQAIYGLHASGGAEIELKASVFDQNREHVYLQNYPTVGLSSFAPVVFDSVSFLCTDSLIAPYSGGITLNGIRLESVPKIKVGDSLYGENLFSGIVHGINSSGSDLYVYHNRFYELVDDTVAADPGCGIVFTGPAFGTSRNYLEVGKDTLSGHYNRFDSLITGIRVDRKSDVSVKGNRFNYMQMDGIWMSTLTDCEIYVGLNRFTDARYGIFGNIWTSSLATIEKNSFLSQNDTLLHTAITLDGIYPDLSLGNDQVLVANNDISVRGTGIFLRNAELLSVNLNEVELFDSLGNDTLWGIYAEGCEDIYLYENFVETDYDELDDTLRTGIYVQEGIGTTLSCNEVQNFGRAIVWNDDSEPSDMFFNVIRNSRQGLVFEADGRIGDQGILDETNHKNRWIGTFNRSHTFANNSPGNLSPFTAPSNISEYSPSLNLSDGSGIPVPFPNSASESNPLTNDCVDWEEPSSEGESEALMKGAGSEEEDYAYYPETNAWEKHKWVYEELSKDSTLANSDSVFAEFLQENQDSSIAKQTAIEHSISKLEFSLAESTNQSMDVKKDVERNHYRSNASLLKVLQNQGINESEKTLLSEIALVCPDEGGKGVYLARSVLPLYGIRIGHLNSCSYVSPEKRNFEEELDPTERKIVFYPNPAHQEIHFDYKNGGVKSWEVSVTDNWGREIFQGNLRQSSSSFRISVRHWAKGLYYFAIRDKNVLHTGTFIVD